MAGTMARYNRMVRASFAAEDRKVAEARAYQRKHGLERRGKELRLVYLRRLYPIYIPKLDAAHPLERNHAGRELTKILREVAVLQRSLGIAHKGGNDGAGKLRS